MQIIYAEPITSQLQAVIQTAAESKKRIERIILTAEEMAELKESLPGGPDGPTPTSVAGVTVEVDPGL